jgi:hypothetical protein
MYSEPRHIITLNGNPKIQYLSRWRQDLETIKPTLSEAQYKTALLYHEAADLFDYAVAEKLYQITPRLFERVVKRVDRRFEELKLAWKLTEIDITKETN